MKIMKIKNKKMFNCSKYSPTYADRSHHYLVYKNKKQEYEALQLNHLYILDKKRLKKLEKGFYLKEKFKEFDCPSLVDKRKYKKNQYNNFEFNKNKDYKKARRISKKQKDRILSWINK